MDINVDLVKELIKTQYPKFSNLEIKMVKKSGHDNRTFHLGDSMSIRLPSGPSYASQIEKELTWLPKLKSYISLPIPCPIAKGEPSDKYPFNWAINRWLEGETVDYDNISDLNELAVDLARFLKELQSIDASLGPIAGEHNFHRGGNISVYHSEYIELVDNLYKFIGVEKSLLLEIWNLGLNSKWTKKPVWVHGDLVATNMLALNGKLEAIIDFGILGVGDPACDLSMYWTFFDKKSREIFKSELDFDKSTWDRARAWVIWKQLFDIQYHVNDDSKTTKLKKIVLDLIDEYKLNNSKSLITDEINKRN